MTVKTEDWARRFIAKRLKVSIKGKRKDHQWHDIVTKLVNTLDHQERLIEYAAGQLAGEDI